MFEPNKIIEEVKQRLVKLYNPIAIYITGPYAEGTANLQSTMNITVVFDEIKIDYADLWEQGFDALSDLDIPNNLKLLNKDFFQKETNIKIEYGMEEPIKKIYEKG